METQKELKPYLRFNGDYKSLKKMDELHFRVKVNSLCATKSIRKAAERIKVTANHLHDFISREEITPDDLEMMRLDYRRRLRVRNIKN